MARRKEVRNVNPTSIVLQADVSLDQVGIFDHLTPRLQILLANAKKFKERCSYAFCWLYGCGKTKDLDPLHSRIQT